MINHLPIHPIQVAIYAILTGDAAYMALSTGGVYDQVPEEKPLPYTRIGDHLSTPDNTHTSFGREITTNLHFWTHARGNAEGQAMATRAAELLDHQHAALTAALGAVPHRVVSIRLEFDQALSDPDPQVRHHVQRYRVCTTQLEE